MRPHFFESAAACRRWLEAHHAGTGEAWFGFRRKDSGRGGITYSEALDEALCFGWIDGVRRRLDDTSYVIRFTPRRPGSKWSRVNAARARALIAGGRMTPPGRAAFDRRRERHPVEYSYESARESLPASWRRRFAAQRRAWAYFEAQPPGYRRIALHWVLSAKREETRLRRFGVLVACSAARERLPQTLPSVRKKK